MLASRKHGAASECRRLGCHRRATSVLHHTDRCEQLGPAEIGLVPHYKFNRLRCSNDAVIGSPWSRFPHRGSQLHGTSGDARPRSSAIVNSRHIRRMVSTAGWPVIRRKCGPSHARTVSRLGSVTRLARCSRPVPATMTLEKCKPAWAHGVPLAVRHAHRACGTQRVSGKRRDTCQIGACVGCHLTVRGYVQ